MQRVSSSAMILRASVLRPAALLAVVLASGASQAAGPATMPEIRTTERNRVPACVTPEKLQRFLGDSNGNLMPKFREIARLYKEHGERLRVRWDYAFFQMVIETNYLKFENARGKGDVAPKQNNFAGLGTTGGGVPGDSFPDVSTGVLAQFQHLVAYSGERVANPVAPRTREKQDDIVQRSLALRRPVTFKDLAGRWAADRRYGVSIEAIASRFRATYCNGPEPAPQPETTPPAGVPVAEAVTKRETPRVKALVTGGTERQAPTRPARGEVPPQPAAAAKPAPPTEVTAKAERPEKAPAQGQSRLALAKPAPAGGACAVLTASYGGARNVLIRAESSGETQYTALQVLDGQEQRLAKSFIRTHAAGGEAIGEFPSREAALAKAFELCPSARVAQ